MPYPTKEELTEWFQLQETGQAPKFFDLYVSDDVIWTVEGTHPIAGVFHGKKEFMAGTLAILRGAMKPGIWNVKVTNVIAGGEQAAVELTINSEQKNGAPFMNKYCWLMKFDENKKIIEGKTFFDSYLVAKAINDNK